MKDLYPPLHRNARTMLFVDGENLAMRYGEMLALAKEANGGVDPTPRIQGAVWHEYPNVAMWAQFMSPHPSYASSLVRRYYYTSVCGDEPKRETIEAWLKARDFEAPRVFHRDKNRGSKQVDISLATEMLSHAHRRHFEVAILVSGDADYCPLVRAVRGEGARVHVWAFTKGLGKKLEIEADHFAALDPYFGF